MKNTLFAIALTLMTSVPAFAAGTPHLNFIECERSTPIKRGTFAPLRFQLYTHTQETDLIIVGTLGNVLGRSVSYAVSGPNLGKRGDFVLQPVDSYADETYAVHISDDFKQITGEVAVQGRVTAKYACAML